jgi:dTDP-glucose pyrophosphorylase
MYRVQNRNIDGAIITFVCEKKDDKRWSYAKLDTDGFVQEVREKEPISDLATVGLYYFRRASDFLKYAAEMIEKADFRVNNEHYVCPVYNFMIKDGKKIVTFNCEKMYGTGDPESLALFQREYHGEI